MNMQGVNMNFSQFNVSMFSMASQQVQMAQPQQLQQLQSLMTQAFQSLFQAAAGGGFQALMGNSFPQMPTPGYTMPPGPGVQFPTNPSIGTPQPGDGKTGLIQTGKEPLEFVTPGGYKIQALGKDAGWEITTPEGQKSKIWGDPHVKESDGGQWDFKKGMSFVLPDGTKITANTTPPGPSGYTVTQSIDIMNGNQRATISGIDQNKPQSEGVKNDRWQVDARTPDGDYAVLGGDGADWFLHGKNEIVGSEKQGEILKTAQGGARGITQKAQEAMQEVPRFGSPEFMQQIMQQTLQQMMGPSPFGQFGQMNPFQNGMNMPQMPGPQPGMGGWGMPGGMPGQNPMMGPQMGFGFEAIGNMFNMLRNLTQTAQQLFQNIRNQQMPGMPQMPTQTPQQVNPQQQAATQKFDQILETFHQDKVLGRGQQGPFGLQLKGDDQADNMIRDLTKNPEMLGGLDTKQKTRLLQMLLEQTTLPHGGNQTAMLDILRSAKNPEEFKQMMDGAGGQMPFHKAMHDVDQGSFNFLLEKNGVQQWKPPFMLPFFPNPAMN